MRVLHILPSTASGGAETMLARLLEASRRGNDKVAVLSLREPGESGERMRDSGVRLYTLRMADRFRTPFSVLRLIRIVNAYAPDIIHGWTLPGSLAASIARASLGRPVSIAWNLRNSLRSEAVTPTRNRQWMQFGIWLSNQPDAIVFNSRTAARQHAQAGFETERSVLIPNGFDAELFRPDPAARERLQQRFGISAGSFVVGSLGLNHPMKDRATLVEAVARARALGRDIHLLMAGQGMDQADRALREKAARLLPPDRVTFAATRNDVADWLPGLDTLAMTSAWGESFPQVIGEAMAAGVPILATDVGDTREIVGDAGIVLPPKDAIGLGQALDRLASLSPADRAAMGGLGRQRVIENYAIEAVADRYADLHSRLYDDSRFLGRPTKRQDMLVQGTPQ